MQDKTGRGKRLSAGEIFLVFTSILILLAFVSLFMGRFTVPPREVAAILGSKLFGATDASVNATVIWEIRLPRILLAMLIGAGLSVSGAAFQGCFHNPLVSPDMLGVSAGAGFGAALGILLTNETNALTGAFSFSLGLSSVFLSWFLSRIRKDSGMLSLVLAGVIVSAVFNALISLTKLVADTESQLPAITFWLMGSLNGTTFRTFGSAVFPVALGMILLLALRWRINVLTLGDDEARSLGVNPRGFACW
jgi:iron complex transport system permease protein